MFKINVEVFSGQINHCTALSLPHCAGHNKGARTVQQACVLFPLRAVMYDGGQTTTRKSPQLLTGSHVRCTGGWLLGLYSQITFFHHLNFSLFLSIYAMYIKTL